MVLPKLPDLAPLPPVKSAPLYVRASWLTHVNVMNIAKAITSPELHAALGTRQVGDRQRYGGNSALEANPDGCEPVAGAQ